MRAAGNPAIAYLLPLMSHPGNTPQLGQFAAVQGIASGRGIHRDTDGCGFLRRRAYPANAAGAHQIPFENRSGFPIRGGEKLKQRPGVPLERVGVFTPMCSDAETNAASITRPCELL